MRKLDKILAKKVRREREVKRDRILLQQRYGLQSICFAMHVELDVIAQRCSYVAR